jgi:ribosomal protein S18 acetylase RimI-like enzyme
VLLRAPRRDEAQAVHAVILARDVADVGRPDYSLADVLADWDLPGYDPEHDVFVVEDGDGTLVGWADVGEGSARVAVHPAHEGRGVGTLLREAIERRTRERGYRVAQQVVAANAGAAAHLGAAGYERAQVYQRMRAAMGDVPAPPAGAAVRRFDLDAEGGAVHELIEAAFGEIEGNTPQAYARWHAEVAAGSEPAFRLAIEDDDGLVAAAVGERWEDCVGYVKQLAVAGRARGQGHGRTLLLALLDALRRAGSQTAELSVAGTNAPATGLYESAGMAPDFAIERWDLTRSSG